MTVETSYWPYYWPTMSNVERLRLVSVLFDEAKPNDIVYMSPLPFFGYHRWWPMRWDDAD